MGALFVATSSALAHRPGFRHLDHIADANVFEAICGQLSLSEAQRGSYQVVFRSYFGHVARLEREAESEIRRHIQWRESLDVDDNSQDALVAEAEFDNRLNEAVAIANRKADNFLQLFYDQLVEQLSDDQLTRLPAIKRMVRRMNALGGERRKHAMRFAYFFDLIALGEEASGIGGELQALMSKPPAALPDDLATSRAVIDEALSAYELRIDWLLRKRERARRFVERTKPGDTTIDRRTRRGRQWVQRRATSWCRVYQTTAEPAEIIALAIGEALGTDALRQWHLRYWRAWDSVGFRELPLDTLSTWLEQRSVDSLGTELLDQIADGQLFMDEVPRWMASHLSPEQQRAIQELYEHYLTHRHRLQQRVFEAAVKAICRDYSLRGNDAEHLRYAQAILAIIQLHDRMIEKMAALLEPDDAARFRNRFSDPFLRHTLSEDITVHARIAVGLFDPDTYRPVLWNPEEKAYHEFRPSWDPDTEMWMLVLNTVHHQDE